MKYCIVFNIRIVIYYNIKCIYKKSINDTILFVKIYTHIDAGMLFYIIYFILFKHYYVNLVFLLHYFTALNNT